MVEVKESDISMDLLKILVENGYIEIWLINGMVCGLSAQVAITNWSLCIGLDETGYAFRYCFRTLLDARAAIEEFDFSKDPENFIVRKGLGEDFHPGDKKGSLRAAVLAYQKEMPDAT